MREVSSVRAVLILSISLLATACNVDNDPQNEKVTVKYDRERIHKAGHAAKEVATGAANVAKSTGRAIKREVGDVDVKVTRTPSSDAQEK